MPGASAGDHFPPLVTTPPPPADFSADFAAALADRYRIERTLGAGGMATVYLAEDLRHRRRVAVKVLHRDLGALLGADRFQREIETTANLRHPHVLPLFDSGEAAGRLFYVMPYVHGESLRERLQRDGRLPVAEALTIAREVADALGHAHAQGVVHRDVKPDNILLEGGHAVVADFGIARALHVTGDEALTQTGLAVGTPRYMSPEQSTAERELDGRSDLYSLGCVLYEMLAGTPPFTGPSAAAIARQHLLDDAPPLADRCPDAPSAVADLVDRLLAKTADDRPRDAGEVVAVLTAVLSGASPALTPAPTRRGAGAGSAARGTTGVPRRLLVALAVIAILAVAAWLGSRPATTPAAAGTRTIERVAVLPLDNATGDATQQYYADGMTRELIGVLSEVGVRTLGHRAVAAVDVSAQPVAEIALALDVDALVTGAVLRVGDEVQIAVELVDPATSETLWGRTFTRPGRDVVTLQRDIAAEIARGLQARLTPQQEARLAAARPVDPRAYTQYLLGQEQANLRTPEGFTRSFEHLERAIAIDSSFAQAWAALAMSSAYALIYQTAPRDATRALLERAAARAIALDPELGDTYYALGTARVHMDWDFAGGDSLFGLGRVRSPSTQALALRGWIEWETRQWRAALETTRELTEREPTTAQWRSDRAWTLWSSGDLPAARASAERGIADDSSFYEAHDVLSLILGDLGEHAAADSAHARATRLAGGDYWVRDFNTGMLAAARGDTAGVRGAIAALRDDPRLAQRASLQLLVGDTAGMYALFDRAVEARDPDILQMVNGMPILYGVRDTPRFQTLLARIGLPVEVR